MREEENNDNRVMISQIICVTLQKEKTKRYDVCLKKETI